MISHGTWEKLTTYLQLAGAALTIPVAAAGLYALYRSYVTDEAGCHELHRTIVAIMEKNVPPDSKPALLHRDVTEFGKRCATFDPDSDAIFQAAILPRLIGGAPPSRPVQTVDAAGTAQSQPGDFGLSPNGLRRGWVALIRREPGREPEAHFDGYAVTDAALPSPGAMLTARRMLPVWIEPLPPGANDPAKLQGRLAAGACVRVLATRPGPGRQWAEVSPC